MLGQISLFFVFRHRRQSIRATACPVPFYLSIVRSIIGSIVFLRSILSTRARTCREITGISNCRYACTRNCARMQQCLARSVLKRTVFQLRNVTNSDATRVLSLWTRSRVTSNKFSVMRKINQKLRSSLARVSPFWIFFKVLPCFPRSDNGRALRTTGGFRNDNACNGNNTLQESLLPNQARIRTPNPEICELIVLEATTTNATCRESARMEFGGKYNILPSLNTYLGTYLVTSTRLNGYHVSFSTVLKFGSVLFFSRCISFFLRFYPPYFEIKGRTMTRKRRTRQQIDLRPQYDT